MTMTMAIVLASVMMTAGAVTVTGVYVHRARKKAEEQRDRDTEIRRTLERENAEKSSLITKMSHQIGTSANRIAAVSRTAIHKLDEKENVEVCLNTINDSSKHLLEVVNDVLDLTRLEDGKTKVNADVFNFRILIRSFEMIFQEQTQKAGLRFEMVMDCDVDEPLVGDVLRVNQIIHSLMQNALQYTEAGGKIILRVQTVKMTERQVWIRFSVIDTGCGIEEEDFERIFLPFERIKGRSGDGRDNAGLGLYIVKKFTELMGGKVRMHSKVGCGSTFAVDIPFERIGEEDVPADHAYSDDTEESSIYDFRGRKILIAEDNELHMQIIAELIQMTGAACDRVMNGREAVEKFSASDQGEYDMILMDIEMPVMDGYEATRRIRKMNRKDAASIPIFALTANTFEEDEIKSWDQGMNGHINKPINPDRIYAQMDRVMKDAEG